MGHFYSIIAPQSGSLLLYRNQSRSNFRAYFRSCVTSCGLQQGEVIWHVCVSNHPLGPFGGGAYGLSYKLWKEDIVNKTVVYARVSTRGQNPENQLLVLRKYAEARGLEIVDSYVDVGQSEGKASRPELDRLMMDARRRKFNVVLVARLDRLARSLKQLVMTLDELRELGIAFVSLQEAFDTSTSTGILLFQVVGAIAEFERSLIRERIALDLERARAEGKTIGRPLGAQVDEQELRRLRSQGLSLRAFARQVGISHPTVAVILNGKNPTPMCSLEDP